MKRRQAREHAILALFEASFQANSIEEIIAMSRDGGEYAVDAYGQALLTHFYAHSSEVDEAVSAKLKDWSLVRLPRVNAAILRMAATEMMYSEEDMDSIVINEAVEIAKKYASDGDYQFINGVLGTLARELHPAQAKAIEAACETVLDVPSLTELVDLVPVPKQEQAVEAVVGQAATPDEAPEQEQVIQQEA